jgi:subtilisin family serine protease
VVTLGFEGENQVVAVADTGFDVGSTTNVHPAFQGRVARLYALGRPNNANDPNGHGTHVAGSVLGDGISTVLGMAIRGTAPRAQLVLQAVLDSGGGLGGACRMT